MNKLNINDSLPFSNFTISKKLGVLVLAPHPDDFDAIAVTLRFLYKNENQIYLSVLTSGASGVEDSFCSPPSTENKSRLREKEQIASCLYFGLTIEQIVFLRLDEDAHGHPRDNQTNINCIKDQFLSLQPHLVFMPHGNDTNLGHQRAYSMFRQVVQEAGYPLAIFLNRDPKTVKIRCDVFTEYGEETARWKRELLRYHRSQQQRNLNQRGYGLDDRIVNMDRNNAQICSTYSQYAEIFEIELIGANDLDEALGGGIE